jgi:hypothetical protein
MKRYFLALAAIAVLGIIPAVAQDSGDEEEIFVPVYGLGDSTMRINLGLFLPLGFMGGGESWDWANLTPGGVGSIAVDAYLSDNVTIGGELGGSFSFTPNRRTLWMVPIAFRASYILRWYPFEVPLTAGVGMNISKVDDNPHVDFFLKAGGTFQWNYSSEWAFGLNLFYWMVPQIYFPWSEAGTDATRIGNFLEITLSALYHL